MYPRQCPAACRAFLWSLWLDCPRARPCSRRKRAVSRPRGGLVPGPRHPSGRRPFPKSRGTGRSDRGHRAGIRLGTDRTSGLRSGCRLSRRCRVADRRDREPFGRTLGLASRTPLRRRVGGRDPSGPRPRVAGDVSGGPGSVFSPNAGKVPGRARLLGRKRGPSAPSRRPP